MLLYSIYSSTVDTSVVGVNISNPTVCEQLSYCTIKRMPASRLKKKSYYSFPHRADAQNPPILYAHAF